MKSILIAFFALFPFIALYSQTKDSIDVQHLDEVQVTASVRPSETKATVPLQVYTIDKIENTGIVSVSDAVRRFSGVTVKDYGGVGGVKTVSVRGMGAQHTAVLYDGVSVSNIQSGQIDIGQFSLDNLSFISLTIGQSDNIFQSARAFASAALLEINSAAPVFSGKRYSLKSQIKTGSFGLFNPSIYYAYRLSKKFSLSANGSWEHSDGNYPYRYKNVTINEHGKRQNSDVDNFRTEINLYGDLGSGGTLKVKSNFYNSERGLPGSLVLYNDYNKERVWNKDFYTQAHYENRLSEKVSLRSQAKFSRSYYKYIDVDGKYEGGRLENRITQFEYYGSAGIEYRATDYLKVSFSEDYFQNTLKSAVTETQNPKRHTSLSLLALQFNNDHIAITGSLLGTYVTEKAEAGEVPSDRKKLSPAISLSYKPLTSADLRVRASFKKIFRVPTFNDLYYLRMGNVNLKPEHTTQYNIGLTWAGRFSDQFNYASFSIDAYHNDVRDKIVAFMTADIAKMRNFGKVDMDGVDVNAKVNMAVSDKMEISLSGNYSYQRVIDVTNKEDKNYKDQLPYIPRHYGSAAIAFNNPWVNVAYTLIASGSRYSLDQNISENKIDSYLDQSVSVNRSVAVGKCRLWLQVSLLNLANKNYEIIQYYPMPGRSFSASARLEF